MPGISHHIPKTANYWYLVNKSVHERSRRCERERKRLRTLLNIATQMLNFTASIITHYVHYPETCAGTGTRRN